MGTIREVLILEDRFTNPLTRYLQLTSQAATSTATLRGGFSGAKSAADIMASAYKAVSAEISSYIKANFQGAASAAQQSTATREVTAQTKATTAEISKQTAAYKAAEAQTKAETAEINKLIASERLAAQEAKKAAQATEQLSNSQKNATISANSLTGAVKNIVGAYVGVQAIQTLFNWSDSLVSTKARLELVTGSAEAAADATNKIYAAAMRSRSGFADTAASVAKLTTLAGNAFGDINQAVLFVETFNKQMVLSGASAMEASSAIYQITQAMASGVLQGEELKSVLENAPMVAKTIADYLGVSTGTVKTMASEGLITSQIVRDAMLSAVDETNAKMATMPMTWAQVWTSFQNIAIRALNPVLMAISWLANNIAIIGPMVLYLAAAFAVFQIAANSAKIAAIATGVYKFTLDLVKFAYAALTRQTYVATAATAQFAGTMLALPITWVVLGVMLLVAALYAGVAAFNKLTGSSVSATGLIAGTLFALASFVANQVIVPVWNAVAALVNFFGNAFNDPVAAVKVFLLDFAITALGYFKNLAQGIEGFLNAIPGVNLDLTGGITEWENKLKGWRTGAIEGSGYTEYVKRMEYFDLGKSFSVGYNWGANLFSSDSTLLNLGNSAATSALDGSGLAGNVSDIAGSASKIEKSVAMSEEDIKSLVDVAERRYVNNINLTAQTPVINITGQNTGNTAADRQNLADTIRDILIEQVAAGSTRNTAAAF